uniref:Uncharacterized protein n=1 Tax=Lepeophtheirus salmonis TaxID=72036 RepID=A0A0K2VCL4_LEPSM
MHRGPLRLHPLLILLEKSFIQNQHSRVSSVGDPSSPHSLIRIST